MANLPPLISLNEYLEYVKNSNPRSARILTGRFYTYNYLFPKNQNFEKIKWYDRFPLVFVIENRGKTFIGINFHHAPVLPRQIWLARVRKLTALLDKDRRMQTIAEWQRMFYMYKKISDFSVRQYRKDRVQDLRRVPQTLIDDMMKQYANTHYGVNEGQVADKYRKFVPRSNL